MSTLRSDKGSSGEDLSRLLVENIRDYAVYALGPQGRVVTRSAPAERLLDYPKSEVMGQPAERFYTPEDIASDVPAQALRQALEAGRVRKTAGTCARTAPAFRRERGAARLRQDHAG